MRTMKPVLQALLLADHIYEDKATGKKIIAGTFNRLFTAKRSHQPASESEQATGSGPPPNHSPGPPPGQTHGQLPGQPPAQGDASMLLRAGSPYAYISLTDVYSSLKLLLRYVDLEDNSILLQAEIGIEVHQPDPLKTMEMTVPLPPLPTPHPGTYALELLHEGELLGAHRVAVEFIKEKPGPG